MTAEPLPTLADLGPLTDREWRIYALAYNAGREDADRDAFDHGYLAGVQCLLDTETPQPRQRHLRLVAS